MPDWSRRNVRKNVIGLVLAPVVLLMLFRWFEQSQVYHPSHDTEEPPRTLGAAQESFNFPATDGTKLHGWLLRAPESSARKHLVMLYCHGNGGTISDRLGYYQVILAAGVNVLAFDYRGYGRSEGKPGEKGTYSDAHGALAWLKEHGFPASNVIVWGESLGGGIASEVAATEPVDGLVLQSTFTSMPDIGSEVFPFLPVRLIGSIKYDTHARLPNIHCPVLVMHSKTDTLIRFHHGEQNFAAANEPKLFWEIHGDHNDAIDEDAPNFGAGLRKFLELRDTVVKPVPPAAAPSVPSK